MKPRNPKNIPIFGLKDVYENTSLRFTEYGLTITVSLNIPKDIVKFISPKNILHKDGDLNTIRLSKSLWGGHINKKNLQKVHDYLLKNLMVHSRKAKIRKYETEISNLIPVQTKLQFL
jgi:hypothetical protein